MTTILLPWSSEYDARRGPSPAPNLLVGIEMNFVVVASSPAVVPLLDAVAQRLDSAVNAHWSTDPVLSRRIAEHCPRSRECDGWDELLAVPAEAAIVCGNEPSVFEAARQLASVGRSLLVVLDLSVAPAGQFELTGVWQDRGVRIVPVAVSGTYSDAKAVLGRWFSASTVPPRRIEFERTLPLDPDVGPDLTEEQIEKSFFGDALLLRRLGGDFAEVTSLRSGVRGERSTVATVTLAGEPLPDVTWTVHRSPNPGCRIVLHGDLAAVEQQCDLAGGVARDAALELAGFLDEQGPVYSWLDLMRAGELAAAVKRSIEKRRTIRLQFEEGSERSQFKSQMTAVGCAVLLWALFGSMLLMLFATVLDPRDREYKTAAAHAFVVRAEEFRPESDELTHAGSEHLQDIARRWTQTESAVLVEVRHAPPGPLGEARRQSVVDALERSGVRGARTRVVARPLSGQNYETLLRFGWLVAFVPLLLFLLFQGFIIVARG